MGPQGMGSPPASGTHHYTGEGVDTGLGAGEQPTVTIKRNTAKPIRTEYKKAIGIASRGMVAQQSDTLTSANPLRAWLMHMPTRIGQNVNFGRRRPRQPCERCSRPASRHPARHGSCNQHHEPARNGRRHVATRDASQQAATSLYSESTMRRAPAFSRRAR